MVLFASAISTWVFFVLVLIFLGLTLAALVEEWGKVGFIVLGLLFGASSTGWIYSATHRVIPHNNVALTVTASEVSTKLQGPGLAKKPLLASFRYFPSASQAELCQKYTPSVKGGYGVNIDLCFYFDASGVDWSSMVSRYGTTDTGTIYKRWQNQLSPFIAGSTKEFTPAELTDERAKVSSIIRESITPWFVDESVTLSRVALTNWDFSNPDVGAAFDKAIVYQNLVTEENARKAAAEVSRGRQLYEVETANLVAKEQSKVLVNLSLEDDMAKVQFLFMQQLFTNPEALKAVVLNVGGSGTGVSLPSTSAPVVASTE